MKPEAVITKVKWLKCMFYQIDDIMTIKIFGQLVDITGSDSIVLDDVYNSEALEKMLHQKYPALKNTKYKIAVNRNIIQSEVALLPPYSGG